jgi:hypothetical protein
MVPLVAVEAPARRRAALLLGAGAIGLTHGWLARQSGSLVPVGIAHAITGSSGLGAVRRTWLADQESGPA